MASGDARPTLVVLGASGDLAARLLFPALLSLEHRERLANLRVIGYARQEWTDEQFHENLRAAIDLAGAKYDDKYLDRFERSGTTWRFTERIFDPRLVGDLSGHMRNASR